ncbi:Hypothetical protein CINCED_3A019788 [Cinara cedri]|uniref:Uncharacterized protein n=1 Tax=Cinara cedri TaxID=506608 RepID=A0A5E4N3R2_9HEMI|nr:Hypothetical protein CINCED_3A019788 [Cinara cedri]
MMRGRWKPRQGISEEQLDGQVDSKPADAVTPGREIQSLKTDGFGTRVVVNSMNEFPDDGIREPSGIVRLLTGSPKTKIIIRQ